MAQRTRSGSQRGHPRDHQPAGHDRVDLIQHWKVQNQCRAKRHDHATRERRVAILQQHAHHHISCRHAERREHSDRDPRDHRRLIAHPQRVEKHPKKQHRPRRLFPRVHVERFALIRRIVRQQLHRRHVQRLDRVAEVTGVHRAFNEIRDPAQAGRFDRDRNVHNLRRKHGDHDQPDRRASPHRRRAIDQQRHNQRGSRQQHRGEIAQRFDVSPGPFPIRWAVEKRRVKHQQKGKRERDQADDPELPGGLGGAHAMQEVSKESGGFNRSAAWWR